VTTDTREQHTLRSTDWCRGYKVGYGEGYAAGSTHAEDSDVCELDRIVREDMEREIDALVWPEGNDVVDNQDKYEDWY
jgi:hypothetical protein